MNNYYNGIPPYYTPYPNFINTPRFLGTRMSSPFLRNINKINFTSILNGASKTLNVINQAIPVFYQIKPIWQNTKTMFKVAKIIKDDDNKEGEQKEIKKEDNTSNPSFFI